VGSEIEEHSVARQRRFVSRPTSHGERHHQKREGNTGSIQERGVSPEPFDDGRVAQTKERQSSKDVSNVFVELVRSSQAKGDGQQYPTERVLDVVLLEDAVSHGVVAVKSCLSKKRSLAVVIFSVVRVAIDSLMRAYIHASMLLRSSAIHGG
jgi:hypothetical protein